jgi:hypothetical protein
VGKVCLLWAARWTKTLWAYDPDKVKWTKITPRGPQPPAKGRAAVLAYYDEAHNVFVIPGQWVYRYKKK